MLQSTMNGAIYGIDVERMLKCRFFKLKKKEYKKLKKYMKTNMYKIKDMSGKETIVSKLLDEYGGDFDG